MDQLIGSKDVVTNALRDYVIKSDPYSLSYVMYDVTTLYFETDNEDEDDGEIPGLRKKRYSKDRREDLLTELVRVSSLVIALIVNSSSKVSTHARRQNLTRSRLIDGPVYRIVNHDRKPRGYPVEVDIFFRPLVLL